MPDYFISTNARLPLKVDYVSWNFATLVISGNSWGINIDCSWQLYSKDGVFCDEDDDVSQQMQALVGLMLLAVNEKLAGNVKAVDFLFSNEICLKASGEGDIYFGLS